MTIAYAPYEPALDPATGVNWSDDVGVLKTLGMKGVALAVWQRTLPDQLDVWLDGLPTDRLPVLKAIVAIEEVEKVVCAAALSAGLSQGTETSRFAKDVAYLSRLLTAMIPGVMLQIQLKSPSEKKLSENNLLWHPCSAKNQGAMIDVDCFRSVPV